MKKINISKLTGILLLLLGAMPLAGQGLINAGSDIYISPGTQMVVNSDYINLNDGQIDNNGSIKLYGDWVNNGTTTGIVAGGTGVCTLMGNVQQSIGGSSNSLFNSLHLKNNVGLSAHVQVEDEVYLISGTLFLNDYNLNVGHGLCFSSNSYWYHVVTNGNGMLQANIPQGSQKRFIVGYNDFFLNDVYIDNHSSDDLFSVGLKSGILTGGSNGTPIPEIDDCVPVTWNVTPSDIANANYQLKLNWEELQEGSSFNRNQSAIGYFDNSQWKGNTESYAGGGDPWLQSLDSVAFGGYFAVGDLESPMAIVMELKVDLTAFLEGPFNGTDMDTGLHSEGLIPLAQPFNQAPWNYAGTESVTSIPANVVDWVLLEGRDSPTAAQATGSQTFGKQAAFLLKDGSIVGLNGISPVSFLHYHLMYDLCVIVHHRNHLSILSANVLTETNGVYTYDFTSSTSQAYLSGEKDMNGTAVMYGGDANSDGDITTADNTIWENQAGTKGYISPDFDMNAQTDNQDKNDVWTGNVGAVSQVPE